MIIPRLVLMLRKLMPVLTESVYCMHKRGFINTTNLCTCVVCNKAIAVLGYIMGLQLAMWLKLYSVQVMTSEWVRTRSAGLCGVCCVVDIVTNTFLEV